MSGVTWSSSETPEEEAVASRTPGRSRPSRTIVAPCAAPRVEVARHLVAVLARDERPHLGGRARCRRRPTSFGRRSAIVGDELVADVADGDHHADRHAALAGASRSPPTPPRRPPCRGRRRAARPCGSSRRRAPARACRCACRSRRCIARSASSRRSDTAAMSGCSRIASTATLSPCTTLNTPSGRPASCSSSATNSEAPGSFSEGFRMNVFPHAIAFANIHIGTIAGKLNGVMPATTPSGWRIEYDVDPGRHLLGEPALQQVRDAAGELDVLDAALDLAGRVGEHLAVLARHDRARARACVARAARGCGTGCRRAWTARSPARPGTPRRPWRRPRPSPRSSRSRPRAVC